MRYSVTDKPVEYCVLEKPSGLSVYYTGTAELAAQMVKLLNEGSGFDGNTPSFFAETRDTSMEMGMALTLVR